MQQTSESITGAESWLDMDSPFAALAQFYQAFNQQDFELMQNNWLQSEQVSMSNPLGGIKRGWPSIKAVYENIFSGPAKVYVEFFDYSIHASDGMFVAAGRERGQLEFNNQCIDLAIRTSRVYIRQDSSWKQLHHHGSMDNPNLLNQYQNILLK